MCFLTILIKIIELWKVLISWRILFELTNTTCRNAIPVVVQAKPSFSTTTLPKVGPMKDLNWIAYLEILDFIHPNPKAAWNIPETHPYVWKLSSNPFCLKKTVRQVLMCSSTYFTSSRHIWKHGIYNALAAKPKRASETPITQMFLRQVFRKNDFHSLWDIRLQKRTWSNKKHREKCCDWSGNYKNIPFMIFIH